MEVFNLDIIPGKSAPVIHASQYDVGREFKANLFEGPAVYTLSGAETLAVYVRKPDGNMVTVAVTNTSDSYIIFETTEQMTACDGANLCELRIENGADVIGSINFIMEVEKSPDTGITSASEIHNLEAQVNAFTAIAVADQYDSANVIFDNSPTPGHGNGYAVTSEGVATALGTKADTSSLAAVATAGTLESLSDTTITNPSSGQVLSYDGGKWKNGNAEYIAGDGVLINELTCAGMIWNSRKTIQFFVPLNKPVKSGTTVSITGGRFYIYSNLGTANEYFSNITIDFITPVSNGVSIKLTNSTAFYNSGNDTSVTVWLDGLRLSFA